MLFIFYKISITKQTKQQSNLKKMSTATETRRINQHLSLMIPRVFPQWIDEATFIDIFERQHIGRVGKVSIKRKADEPGRDYPIYQAYIYFSVWYDNEIAYNFQQRIFGPKKQARVVYDDPWFWVVFENKKQRLSPADKRLLRIDAQQYADKVNVEDLHDKVEQIQDDAELDIDELNERMNAEFDNTDYRLLKCEEMLRAMNDRIQELDASLTAMEKRVQEKDKRKWVVKPYTGTGRYGVSEVFVMETIGEELELSETAMRVAEAVLYDE